MKLRRAISLLTGVALLGAIAAFNEMTPAAQTSLLVTAAEMTRATVQSLWFSAVAAYDEMMGASAQPAEQPVKPVTTGEAPPRRSAALTPDPAESPPAGNPLWALPLKQLSTTRDRPLFSPSRRPPPPATPAYVAPVAVRQPVKPAEPERPAIALLGTIIGTDDRMGVFLETATQNIVRLHVGEDHQGWVLRLIKTREVTLVKDGEQAVVLELPPPGDSPMVGGQIPGGLPGTGTIPPPATPPNARQSRRGR